MTTEQRYDKFKHILLYWCKRFHKQYGGSIDDIVADANLIFSTYAPRYDPSYGTNFEQFMIYFLRKRIDYTYLKRRRRNKIIKQQEMTDEIEDRMIEVESRFDWKEWVLQLTDEAASVVGAVIEVPSELRDLLINHENKQHTPERNFRRSLRSYFRSLGLNRYEIKYAFREIKETL